MKMGTKSLLVGYHQFLIHPLLVAAAWWKLYGFPLDPRVWVAFFIHDLGYIGKPNMDGVEGQQHPFLGAKILSTLFDWGGEVEWYLFSLYHSRTLSKLYFGKLSRLGYADKLAFMYYPKWLLKLLYRASGEGEEYLKNNSLTDWDEWYRVAAEHNVRTLEDAHKENRNEG